MIALNTWEEANVRAEDVLVHRSGWGVVVNQGSIVSLDRMLVEHSDYGLIVLQSASLAARDLSVVDGSIGRRRPGGAILIGMSAAATLERVLVEDATTVGLEVYARGVLDVTDLTVRGTRTVPAWGFGYGVIGDHAEAHFLRAEVADNRGVGLIAFGLDARAALEDLVVRSSRPIDCGADPVAECVGIGGYGIVAIDDSVVEATRFVVDDNDLSGILIAGTGGMDLHTGVVSNHPVGAAIMAPGFDLARIEDDVRWIDNDRALSTASLPIPPVPEL